MSYLSIEEVKQQPHLFVFPQTLFNTKATFAECLFIRRDQRSSEEGVVFEQKGYSEHGNYPVFVCDTDRQLMAYLLNERFLLYLTTKENEWPGDGIEFGMPTGRLEVTSPDTFEVTKYYFRLVVNPHIERQHFDEAHIHEVIKVLFMDQLRYKHTSIPIKVFSLPISKCLHEHHESMGVDFTSDREVDITLAPGCWITLKEIGKKPPSTTSSGTYRIYFPTYRFRNYIHEFEHNGSTYQASLETFDVVLEKTVELLPIINQTFFK